MQPVSTGQLSEHLPGDRPTSPLAQNGRRVPVGYWGSVALALLVGLALRVWNLTGADLWTDEVLTARRVRLPLRESLESILQPGNQMPFYYMLLRLLPGDGAGWLRGTSVVFGMLGIVLFMVVVWALYRDRRVMLAGAWLLAVHPMVVDLSRMARFYTLLFVLTLLIVLSFFWLVRGRCARWVWGLLFTSSLLAYMTHYTTLALPATQFFFLLLTWHSNRALWWRWVGVQFAAVVPLVIWMALSLMHTTKLDGYVYMIQYPTLIDSGVTMLNLVMGFNGSGDWFIAPGVVAAGLGLAAGVLFALRTGWLARQAPDQRAENLYWLLLALVPVIVLSALTYLLGVQYRDRYFIMAMPAFLLLSLWGWRLLPHPGEILVFGLVLLTSLYSTVATFADGSYERTDWHGLGEFIAREFQPGDVLVFERTVKFQAFELEYDGPAEALDNSVILLDAADTDAIERSSDRIWVIVRVRHEDLHRSGWQHGFDPLERDVSAISDWLYERQDRVVRTERFKGLYVFLLVGR